MKWQSLKRFCDENFPEMKFKNDVQRKAFLVKKDIRLQKDDKGVEGVVQLRDGEDEKEIKVGKRLSAAKIRQADFGDGSEFDRETRENYHQKNSKGLTVASNTQAGWALLQLLFLLLLLLPLLLLFLLLWLSSLFLLSLLLSDTGGAFCCSGA